MNEVENITCGAPKPVKPQHHQLGLESTTLSERWNVGCGSNSCQGLSLPIIEGETVKFKNWRTAFLSIDYGALAEEGLQRAIASGWDTKSSICIGSLSGGTGRDLGEREQTISHFGDEFTHRQLGEPARRDVVHAVESTAKLAKHGCGCVGIVAQVCSE
jgi:hypothetical protein